MTRRGRGDAEPILGSVVLDSEGLVRWLNDDRRVKLLIRETQIAQRQIVISAMTIIEADYGVSQHPRLDWVLSMCRVIPVTEDLAKAASRRLRSAGLRGHTQAIDATVAETAARVAWPVVLLTSDPGDLTKLVDPAVKVVPLH